MRTKKRKLDELKTDPANARSHSPANLEAIKSSLEAFGQQKPIVVSEAGVVIAGNGTLEAARSLGWEALDCVTTDLAGDEAKAFAIADNRTAELAHWDYDVLTEQLGALHEDLRAALCFTDEELAESLADSETDIDGTYTTKIEAPIYEPTGAKPEPSTLADRTKTEALHLEISEADLPEEVSEFLHYAAERHTVFNFPRIAEFYAHADEKTQDLMEKSALVIIDFDKAIENGFVNLTNKIGDFIDLEAEGNA